MSKIYDVIVLGAGPAGLAAGLYAGRRRKDRTADRLRSQTRSRTIRDRSWKENPDRP